VIVADANVLMYLRVQTEPYTSRAEAVLRQDAEWAVPLFWRSEVRQALAGTLVRRLLTLEEALGALADMEHVVGRREYAVDSARVLALAQGSRCSAYDCEYVALAEALDIPLVTEDRALLKAFPGRAVSPAWFITRQ
jgi:predicted nucleic acid-binding protein